jgi:alcohol dehydrogenase class IV
MWFFRSPTIVFGEEALLHIRELRGQRAFVVTDKVVNAKGLVAPVLFQLQHAGISARVYDTLEAEPALDAIEAGADAMEDYEPDWIVAVGGGSVIDAAKAMWVLYENPDLELEAISPLEPIKLRERARLIAVPTTAGTGSEVTWAFVVTIPATDGAPARKLGSGHPLAVPDYAIVDPVMTASKPRQITADAGLDALTQAIEGYLATWANDYSDGLCLVATRIAFEHLPRVIVNPGDLESREKMANAAAIAGLGYINSMVGLAHSMGHALGAAFKLPHGRAVGLCLPYVLQFYAGDEHGTRSLDIVRFLGDAAEGEAAACRLLADRVRALAIGIEQPVTLADAGVTREAFDAALQDLIETAMGDTVIFTSPRQPSEDELRRLFECAYEGSDVEF